MDTIFALSTGVPPAGVAIVRVSGPNARDALQVLVGQVPAARYALRCSFRDTDGALIDDGLALFFPGPHSVTGEDLAEFHCHGGRAIVAALEAALECIAQCRRAQPGEFTRRAFANGRIDLAEAEGLADLLAAETEVQRRAALGMARGSFTRQIEGWREEVLGLSAAVEAVLDFSDEDDVDGLGPDFAAGLHRLVQIVRTALEAPSAESLQGGLRVALAGPPNAGKSTLFNSLVGEEAAITSAIAGTTRDVIERRVALDGLPFCFVDMAGLRSDPGDDIEAIGIARAEAQVAGSDLVLWLGPDDAVPSGAWNIAARADADDCDVKLAPDFVLSARTGQGMAELRHALVTFARTAFHIDAGYALNARQRAHLNAFHDSLVEAQKQSDLLLAGECLRKARYALDSLQGRVSTEAVLGAVFGRFCIGK